jgi:D-alanyl-D-alanine carboxypeptidase (penicillin-binding protein 5/6)
MMTQSLLQSLLKRFSWLLALPWLMVLAQPAPDPAPVPAAPPPAPTPAPPAVGGNAFLLVDHDSGFVIAESNADQRLEPASLTKIMTAYVVFRELRYGTLKLEDQVLISEHAWRTGGSRMFAEVGKQLLLEDLLKGMIIQSGNDASVALAEHIAGSEDSFASLMNNHARRLGMAESHFTNATGLPHADHYTTARDLVRVTSATIREFPDWYAWYAIKEYHHNNITQHNRNRLLWRDESADGVKTGHTEAAGFCLVSSARRDGMRLISVVLGARSDAARTTDSLALLNYGFRFFETHRLYEREQALTGVRVWKGAIKELPVGPAEAVHATVPRRQYSKLAPRMEVDPQLMAPLTKGQRVGRVVVELSGRVIREVPLVALQEVPEGGLWAKLRDTVLLWFE